MIIRVRTKIATWRVNDVEPTMTIAQVKEKIFKEKNVKPNPSQKFSADPSGKQPLRETDTVEGLGLKNGDMIYFHIQEEDCAAEAGKKIAADGTIINKTYEEVAKERGFRPGMMSLRSMRMQWTLTDFVELDQQFEFKIKRQEKAICTKANLDDASCDSFQSYMRALGFGQCRIGYLYGRFEEGNQVNVHAIYEPPQEGTPFKVQLFEDERAEKVEALAALLKLERVGWIFAHPPREEGFLFSGDEILQAAEGQLISANGVKETSFVTVRCTFTDEVHFDAFQVSLQCMQMAADGALVEAEEPGSLAIQDSFSAIVEGKEAKTVDTNFFLALVPVGSFQTDLFVSTFPKYNRHGEPPSQGALRAQLAKANQRGFSLVDQLADFHLLLFLTEYLDIKTDMPIICNSIVDRSKPIPEGYVEIIRSIAGS